jgi:hypothetical protein
MVEKRHYRVTLSFLSAITGAAGQMNEISDAHVGGLGFGTWMVFAVVAALMITFIVCSVRKLTLVRTIRY